MDAAADHRPVQAPISSEDDMCFVMWCMILSLLVPCTLLFSGMCFVMEHNFGQMPHYSAAVDSVSRLDPVFGRGQNKNPRLDMEFNLTLRVASRGFWDRQCAGAGMRAEVSYHGVSLATSAATTEALCAAPMMAVDRAVVARGAGVMVPGSVLDSLAADMRNEAQVFDIQLHGWGSAIWTCGPRRVGDGAALEMDCVLPTAPAMDTHSRSSRSIQLH